jgi:23S rRNA pseudouridine2605 synthase
MVMERLQKVLARAGFGSRRSCEQLMVEGRVTVDGAVVRELGTRVDPASASITCDGQTVRPQRFVYYALNKPANVVCTNRDPQGRRTILDLLPPGGERVYSVGRLDEDSEGLLIVTNDGALCNLLTHPRYGITKTYHVVVRGELGGEAIERVQRGVWLSEGRTSGARVLVKKRSRDVSVVEVTIAEGMNREIRRVFARVGHPVDRLRRIRVGPVELGDLPPGSYRALSPEEVAALRAAAERGLREEPRLEGPEAPTAATPAAGGERPASQDGPETRPTRPSGPPREFHPSKGRREDRESRGPREAGRPGRFQGRREGWREDRGAGGGKPPGGPRSDKPRFGGPRSDRPAFEGSRPASPRSDRPRFGGPRPGGPRPDRPRFGGPRAGGFRSDKPRFGAPRSDRPGFEGSRPGGPRSDRPAFEGSRSDRPRFGGPPAGRPGSGGSRPGGPRSDKPRFGGSRPEGFSSEKPRFGGPRSDRPGFGGSRPGGSRPGGSRPGGSRPGGSRPGGSRPGGSRFGGSGPGGSRPGGPRRFGGRPGGRPR